MALKPEEARALASFRKAALTAAKGKLKYSDRAVYRSLVDCIHYPDMTARKARATIAEEVGLCERTVKYALSRLRAAGAIKAVSYAKGGRARTPDYAFCWVGEKGGNNEPPKDAPETGKRGQYCADKGGNNVPPHNRGSKYNKAGPSRPEVDKVPDDIRHTENRLLSEWTRLHGYGQARIMILEWREKQGLAA